MGEVFRDLDQLTANGILREYAEAPQNEPRPHWMRPRYQAPGNDVTISVFRGEGQALFLLARWLRPALIVEKYTGTGYSSACLAAGSPFSEVLSVDNYGEGGAGDAGWRTALAVRDHMRLENLRLIRGTDSDLQDALNGRYPGLVFLDPYLAECSFVQEWCVVARHDGPVHPFLPAPHIRLPRSSYFTVSCGNARRLRSTFDRLADVLPVEMVSD